LKFHQNKKKSKTFKHFYGLVGTLSDRSGGGAIQNSLRRTNLQSDLHHQYSKRPEPYQLSNHYNFQIIFTQCFDNADRVTGRASDL